MASELGSAEAPAILQKLPQQACRGDEEQGGEKRDEKEKHQGLLTSNKWGEFVIHK